MLSVGSVFAGYRIERVLGAGGMGTVYLGQSPDLPRSDALKVLSADLSRDDEFRARFIREADVASTLDHPNIISIYRRGETADGQLWIAMQFVDGTDADAVLRAGLMTPARAVRIIAEVGKALDYAHQHNVVHRDVKPANFLLSGPVGPDERVLLGDFGIARALDDVGLTVTGSVMATVSYAAPEVFASLPLDGRADLYSLGCTLFRMLTGRTPFSTANGMAAVIAAHLQQPPPKVTELVPELPDQMNRVIATAMAKVPEKRFQSGRELAHAAAAALYDRTTKQTTPWRAIPSADVSSYPHSPGSEPQWWQHTSGPRTLMAPAGQPIRFAPAPTPAVLPTPPPRRRGRRTLWILATLALIVVMVAGVVTAVAMIASGSRREAQPQATTTEPSSPPPVSVVPISALAGLLLPVEEISRIMASDPLVVDLRDDSMFDDSPLIADQTCLSAWMPAEKNVYDNTGWTAVQSQILRAHPKEIWELSVIQAVVAFPSATKATDFFANQSVTWSRCGGRTITHNVIGGSEQKWDFTGTRTTGHTLTLSSSRQGGDGFCERALTTRGNVAVDVLACRPEFIGNEGGTIVSNIADKIPQ